MKKNFLTVAAMAVVAFFVSTEIAKAADITFSGQIRTRYEAAEHLNGAATNTTSAFNDATNADDFIASSVRLNAHANINDSTSAFIQLQSNRTWGQSSGATAVARTASALGGGGSGNASGTANDGDASVGVHQAYFTLKNFANLPVAMDAKVGRQEIILDGHRLFGNTVWTMGMQSHDAIVLSHKHDNMALTLGYVLAQEDGRNTDVNDAQDNEVLLAHFNYKGILGGQFSAIYASLFNGCGGANTATAANTLNCTLADNDIHTIGGRQAGQLFGLDYRGEVYYQWGTADGTANGRAIQTTADRTDRDAYMFGVRVGKSFNNVMFKPSVTLWYDYLSGTSDEDQRNGDWKSFNTLFDTGHKFYGLQDLFLGVGGGTGTGTRGLGLQDLAVKFKLNPMPGWTLKLAAHAFATAEGPGASPTTAGYTSAGGSTAGVNAGNNADGYLGNEIDVTLVNKYNANTNIMIGFSNFNGTETFRNIKTTTAASQTIGSDDANWAYVQFDVKF
jgi:hypothetical protein